MKKLFLALLSVALLATSCEKQETLNTIASGEEVTVTVNLAETATRGTNPDGLVYYLEAYFDGEIFASFGSNETGVFEIRLVTGQEFTLVAWADYDQGFYTIGETLEDITVDYTDFALNDELRDAFFGYTEPIVFNTANAVIDMELGRPFGRINVYTLDMDVVKDTKLYPETINLTYAANQFATNFNAFTGQTGANNNVEFTSTVAVSEDNYTEDGALLLTYDYLLAPVSPERGVVNFDLSFNAGDFENVAPYVLPNIPFERNYQTNVYGNLFTKSGDVYITVNEIWEEPALITYVDAEDVQTIIGEVVVGDEITVYLTQDILEGADVTISFPTISEKYAYPLEQTVVNLILTGSIHEGAVLNLWNGSFRGTINVTVAKESAGTINANIYHSILNFDGTKLGKLQVYGETGYVHTVAAGLEVGSLYPRSCEVDVWGTVNDFYCSNAGQFGAPYLVYGVGTDRVDMTEAEALALIDTIGTTYKYAGVKAN